MAPETTVVVAAGFPPPAHPAESDCFARQREVPGHSQELLESARITLIGAGGLGSWVAVALARSGARSLTIVEPDCFDRTNASRQLMYSQDLGQSKAFAVAANLAPHMVGGGVITAIRLPFRDAMLKYAIGADVLVALVDNNAARLEASRYARHSRIPVVFGMLSIDSMRCHVFLQGPRPEHACLACALPNLDPDAVAPCAAVTIASCLLVAGHVTFFVHRTLMRWPENIEPINWRECDLLGRVEDRAAFVERRRDCSLCSAT